MPRLSQLSRSIKDKVALVTGAASGMGRATAHLFADEGARVAVTDLDMGKVQSVVDEITHAGGTAHGWVLDVANAEHRQSVVREITTRWGGLDILVNNAGVVFESALEDPEFESRWAKTFAVVVTAQAQLVRECLPHLTKCGAGRVVNIASTEALGATKGISAYTASKTGVIGLTRSLAVELASRGITVNCICPGAVRTGMTANISDEHKQEFARRRVALKRYADPEEIAHMTLSLVLPAASYLTGVAIPVDGGLTIKNA
ncbi:MAG: SDR family oxidoreductase [Gammaproteobacteria bacterium]|nr:SDR family oxidoreductase [Gammaproteobacteria bacterium]